MSERRSARLKNRALVSIAGPDWRSFLQGLLTQDVESLAEGELRYAALLTPQGRLRFDLFLIGGADGVSVDVAAAARDELIQALKLYRLRAKVEIEADDRALAAAWGAEPTGPGWMRDPRLPELGWRRIGEGMDDDYRPHRLSLGVVDPTEDGAEPLYPIEANLDLLNGIDFKKGCFVGQETTSRMKRRGQIKSRVAPIAYGGAVVDAGAEVLTADGLRAGRVLSSARGRSLALLRIDRALGAELHIDGRTVALDIPPWLAPAFRMETQSIPA